MGDPGRGAAGSVTLRGVDADDAGAVGRGGPAYAAASWRSRLAHDGAQALYLHVPFCVRKCAYCDFASAATAADDPLVRDYRMALERLVRGAGEAGLLGDCRTAYVGGGTPTLMGTGLTELAGVVRGVAPVAELSAEANPDSLDAALAWALAGAGVTRVSVGVQACDDRELRALGRVHGVRQAEEAVRAAVDAGLATSCDLMCATPRQTDASWERAVRQVVAWGATHVSVYPLQIEEGTPLARRADEEGAPYNDEEIQASRMERASEVLGELGLARYEVASYARAGRQCAHNLAYWTGRPYLGLGVAAASMLTTAGYERLRAACSRLPAVREGTARVRLRVTSSAREVARAGRLADLRFEVEELDARERAAEDLMLGMRLVEGVSAELVGIARETLGAERVDAALADAEARGLAREVTRDAACDVLGTTCALWGSSRQVGYAPTERGWLLGNELYAAMWDLATRGSAPS